MESNSDRNKNIIVMMDKIVERTMQMDMIWEWPCGVAYYGISKAYEVTGNEKYILMIKDRVDEFIELGLPSWTVNTCAMGHCLISIYEYTKEEKYWDIVMQKVDYIQNHALRFGENTLQHTVSSNNDFPEQAWADTLFMAAYFLLRVGVKLKDESLINDALNQFKCHIKYLQDPESGLWFHGYNHVERNHMSGFYWGRANAWAAYTMSQVTHILPQPYIYAEYMDILGSLAEQLSALKLLQTPNGLWRTILDDEESYEEISASCGIASAMLSNGNPLYLKYVNKSLAAIMENISDTGRVQNVSAGTAVMNDKNGYKNISRTWIQGWGQGLALALFAEVLKKEEK